MKMAKLTREEEFKILQQSLEAAKRGDQEEAHRLALKVPLAPHLAKALKDLVGAEEMLKEGYDLSEAEAKYGPHWLSS